MRQVIPALCVIGVLTTAVAASNIPPTVSDVTAQQRTDASKLVDICYKVSDPDSPTVHVRVKVSTDGCNTYNFLPVTFREKSPGQPSDIGEGVTPGLGKHIVWDAGEDMPYTFGANFCVAVIADDCVGYTGEMITIPAGPFLMGNSGVGYDATYCDPNEVPQHEVLLSEYQIAKYEVTRGEYHRFILSGGYETPGYDSGYWSDEGWAWRAANNITEPAYWAPQQNWGDPPGTFTQTDRHPVVGVSYYEAEAFCAWAGGRLPTEAEWEKAARWVDPPPGESVEEGTPRVFPWGDVWDVSRCKWLNDPLYPGYQTAPVGSYINPSGESPYGCADMAGNVWEWCKDWYHADYYSQTPPGGWVDPEGPAPGPYRVPRGSSGDDINGSYCRCANRDMRAPTFRDCYYGFRCARTP